MLTAEGYRVVHLSRHGSFEEGKDVLAIAPDGVPCAFQLKGSSGGKITQREWGKYVDQVNRLVEIPIKHPSIDESLPRRVYFVTNGELDEEVRVEIAGRNSDWIRRGHPQLETVVKGELLGRFIETQDDLWPMSLSSERELLEFYLADGTGYLNKPKFAAFLEHLLWEGDETKAEVSRNLACLAIFASYALSPFALLENHVALVEGWTIYLACLSALIEKRNTPNKNWADNKLLALFAIETSLMNLCEEVKGLKHYVAGNPLVDAPFYRGRLTWLVSFVCIYLLRQQRLNPNWKADPWFDEFILANYSKLELWGEAAAPQIFAVILCLSSRGLGHLGDRLLFELLKGIIELNDKEQGISDPYHHLGEVAMMKQGFVEKARPENFKGRSFILESVVLLCARRGWRGTLAEFWKSITSIDFAEFRPDTLWQYCLWECEEGKLHVTKPKAPQSWTELEHNATNVNPTTIPRLFRDVPEALLLFLMAYPHRIQTSAIMYLDSCLYKNGDDQSA